LNILDICFGLGYNTLATLYYIEQNNLDIKVNIYSPEFDKELIKSLANFNYPDEFKKFKPIIHELSTKNEYHRKNINIKIFTGDAREYLKILNNKEHIKFNIIYQDAFSSDVNHNLWTVEYFKDIRALCIPETILTTYSIATPIRLSIYKNNFFIYEYKPLNSNRITIALAKKTIDEGYKYIDMELKQIRNQTAKPLYD